MFKLIVSHDAGISYSPFMESDSVETLLKRTEKREEFMDDISWCRWYIEKDGEPVDEIMCPIHKNILETIGKLNNLNKY